MSKAQFTEVSTPSTPSSGKVVLYAKADGLLYSKDDAGTETLVSGGGGSGANTALSNLAAVAINTSLISDTDSTDDLGSTSVYWRNAYLDTTYLSEQVAPSTPASGKVVIYPKSDGLMYSKSDAGVETLMSGGAGGATVVSAVQVYKSGSDYTTNNTSMTDVDATNVAVTITATGSGKVLVAFIVGARKATAGSMFMRITDGTNNSTEVERLQAFNTTNTLFVVSHIFTTSAGSTTYKLQYRSSDANNAVIESDMGIQAYAMEIK